MEDERTRHYILKQMFKFRFLNIENNSGYRKIGQRMIILGNDLQIFCRR